MKKLISYITLDDNILRLLICLVYIWLFIPIVGCSVAMALSGKKEPNLGAVRVGSTRGEAELQLGSPISSVTMEDGRRMDIYEYELGNEPSTGRAVAHGVLDVVTWGLWEIIGTPAEAIQGKKYQITIYYDSDNRIAAINQPPNLPTAKKEESGASMQKIQQSQQKPEPRIVNTEIEEKLDQIKSLKDKGKISDEEYERMRKEILSIGQAKPPGSGKKK